MRLFWLLLLLPLCAGAQPTLEQSFQELTIRHIQASDAIAAAQAALATAQQRIEDADQVAQQIEDLLAEVVDPIEPPATGLPLEKLSCPELPTGETNHYVFWACTMEADAAWDGVGSHDWKFGVGKHPTTTPENKARLVSERHPSGGGTSWPAQTIAAIGTFEVRTQDGEPFGCTEYWIPSTCHGGPDAENWAGIRAQAALAYVVQRWGDEIDLDQGLQLRGKSLGGGLHAHMIPGWEDKTAAVVVKLGSMNMDAQLELASNSGPHTSYWDQFDLRVQLPQDVSLRAQYRVSYWAGNDGIVDFDPNIQALLNDHKVPHCFMVHGGPHGAPPADDIRPCVEQLATLDRPVVAFTDSSANVACVGTMRCHSSLGLLWQHAGITNSTHQVVIPIRYEPADVGAYLPPMPESVTARVTVYRAGLTPGDLVSWTYLSQGGVETVSADGTITIPALIMDASATFDSLVIVK